MTKLLKSAERSATVAFCQNGPFLAAGSVAGAIDLSFSTSSALEIFSLDFASTSTDLPLAGGGVQAPERFSRLCWGPPGLDAKLYPYGLLGGGLADGSICIWNPARIIGHSAQDGGKGSLLCRLQKHQGAVKGLEFNSFSPNLLASGGVDGDLCIWDVGNPAQPSLYPAMKGGASSGGQPEITYLAWNKKVQHILATCTGAGTVVVWDLKKQRPVISFKDPSGRKRCSVVQWNPEVATQLMVASDDDMSPSLQLWDLRNSVSPIKEFHGHAKGVLGMSWCPQDASFLLSTAKDNRTICWDVAAAEVYCEMPATNNWNFDVQWAPGQLAGVFATATFEGQLGVSSLSACTAPGAEADGGFSIGGASSVAKAKAPAWLKRPMGAAFGFGGKLVQFVNTKRQLPTGEVVEVGSATVSQVMAEPVLVQQSEQFEAAIRGGDREQLRAFCLAKEQQLSGTEDAETWGFLQTHFEGDGRRYLLHKLGFEDAMLPLPQEEQPAPAEGELAAGVEGLSLEQQQAEAAAAADAQAAAAAALVGDGSDFFDQPAENFFDGLAANTPPGMSPKDASGSGAAAGKSSAATPRTPKDRSIIDGPPGEGEQEIQRALFVGNYTGAVEACLKASRFADAMVVASLVGGETWDNARKEYMMAHPHPYMRMVHAMLGNDWQGFIKARPAQMWRETLAAILTSAPYEHFEGLVANLAHRLATSGMHHAATLCYITSGDVESAVREWAKGAAGPNASVSALESLMEKAVVLGLGVSKQSASEALSALIVRYAELLAANGRLGMALDYLEMVPGEASNSVAILKDRIFRSGGVAQAANQPMQPPFPFVAEEVVAAPVQQQQRPAAMQMGGYGGYGAAAQQQQQAQQAYGAQQGYGATAAGGYGGYGAAAAQQQQAHQQQQQNGYAAAGYYGSQQQQPSQTYAYGSSGYGAQAPPSQAAPPVYQPQAPTSTGGGGYGAAPPAVFQPSAAPPQPAAPTYAPPQQQQAPPPAQVFNPAASVPPAMSQPQVYQPGAAAGPQGALPSPSMGAGPPTGPPPVFQPAAAPPAAAVPQVYQHAAAAGPPAGAPGYPPQRAGSLTGAAQPSPTFVPQQGPSPTAAAAAAAAATFAPQMPGVPAAAPKPQPPPAPAGPPANVSITNVDTSKVGPELRPIVNTLVALHQACEAGVGGNPAKRRELEDSSKKLGALLWRLNAGEASHSVTSKLLQLCAALDAGDYALATHVQVGLTTHDWDEASAWLTALKRLIKTRQMLG